MMWPPKALPRNIKILLFCYFLVSSNNVLSMQILMEVLDFNFQLSTTLAKLFLVISYN